jgi:hypothetical protein
MKVAYFLDHDDFRDLADISIMSLRMVSPHARVIHIANDTIAPLSGADEVIRCTMNGNFMRRWSAMRDQLEGEYLFIDCDTVFLQDVSHVFDQKFDVALPHIADPTVKFDGGVVFSRSPAFWHALRTMPSYTAGHDQTPVSEIVTDFNLASFAYAGHLKFLPGAVYSYVPRHSSDLCEGAAIVHYRGPRKKWMRDRYGHW